MFLMYPIATTVQCFANLFIGYVDFDNQHWAKVLQDLAGSFQYASLSTFNIYLHPVRFV